MSRIPSENDAWFLDAASSRHLIERPWTPPPVALPDDAMSVLRRLREFAAMVWNEISGMGGGSRAMVEAHWMSRREHRAVADWVLNLELFVRRVILIAALALKLDPPRAAKRGPRTPGHRSANWRLPETWAVSFRMIPRRGRETHGAAAPDDDHRITRDVPAHGLARRIEALRRAIVQTDAHAHRFARTLQRIAAGNAREDAEPRQLALRHWDFHPDRRTTGKHAVAELMPLCDRLAARELDRWQTPLPEPG